MLHGDVGQGGICGGGVIPGGTGDGEVEEGGLVVLLLGKFQIAGGFCFL